MRFYLFSIALLFTLLSSCSNDNTRDKDDKQVDVTTPTPVDTPAAKPFRLTSEHYPEYFSFEKEEKGFDPCELLTMNDITVTCKPTAAVTINNRNRDKERVCAYHWMGIDSTLCEVRFSVMTYSMDHDKLVQLFKPDANGIIEHTDWGVRWLVGNKVLMVTYTGELIKKVNILTIKDHVRPFRK